MSDQWQGRTVRVSELEARLRRLEQGGSFRLAAEACERWHAWRDHPPGTDVLPVWHAFVAAMDALCVEVAGPAEPEPRP